MIRRLARFAIRALCLLSILACTGAGWLWWRSRTVHVESLLVTTGRASLMLWSSNRDVAVVVQRGWSEPATVRVRCQRGPPAESRGVAFAESGEDTYWQWHGLEQWSFSGRLYLTPDGTRPLPMDDLLTERSTRVSPQMTWWG